jgi:cbb3-type cytochrome oxidase subunit 3
VPAQPFQKADRSGKDWYSVSVETLKSWGLLLLILGLVALGFFSYRIYGRQSLQRDARGAIEQAEGLRLRLSGEKRVAAGFATEYEAGTQSLGEARAKLAARDFGGALDSGRRSRDVLQSILDALALRGGGGQAQFVSLQGEVEFRRGDGGDWQEARSRVQLQAGDTVRTADNGSAEIMFQDGTLYTVRPNTQFIVSPGSAGPGGAPEQTIEMKYGWVNLSTSQSSSNVKTPGAVARVKESSEAFVAVDKGTSQGRFGAYQGSMELASSGGLTRQVAAFQEVVQTGGLLSEPRQMPARPEPVEPVDDLLLDLDSTKRLVLSWAPVPGAARYALQVSRNRLFVDNVIDAENRARTRATLGLRGEGTFQWRVAAFGPNGLQGPWSETRKFRVSSAARNGGGEKQDANPPELDLDDIKTYGSIFMVNGRSEPGARVEVNGEQVKTNADGSFTKAVQLTKEGWNIIEVRARNAWGKETVRRHRVFVENP